MVNGLKQQTKARTRMVFLVQEHGCHVEAGDRGKSKKDARHLQDVLPAVQSGGDKVVMNDNRTRAAQKVLEQEITRKNPHYS